MKLFKSTFNRLSCLVYSSLPVVSGRLSGSEPCLKLEMDDERKYTGRPGWWGLGSWWEAKVPDFVYRESHWQLQLALWDSAGGKSLLFGWSMFHNVGQRKSNKTHRNYLLSLFSFWGLWVLVLFDILYLCQV